jgi:hypothetical protein
MRHFWFPLVEERYVFPGPVGVNLAGTGLVITTATKQCASSMMKRKDGPNGMERKKNE